jgi:peptidoglycan-associated lipoprotein
MNTTQVIKVAAAALAIAMLSACANEVAKPEASSPAGSSVPSSPSPLQPQASGMQPQTLSGNSLKTGQAAAIDKRSIYYDFDSFALKSEFKPVVEAQASYLKQHPRAQVRIEGNCDERGSREYNLALGQRRADAIKNLLELVGVSDGQIEAVSYGKEKPKALGHDEQSWSQNRRSDFEYTRQ